MRSLSNLTEDWATQKNYLEQITYTYALKKVPTKGRLVYEYNPLHNYRDASGKIQDFDTDALQLDLSHPMEINCQPSYDGTVNLILTDHKNKPLLINSRFTVREHNTYEVVDRTGNSDSNLYDKDWLELDTALHKSYSAIPQIDLFNVSEGGNLKVGNYVVYIAYVDADGNETPIAAESGIISCFINQEPSMVRGGYKDENSNKLIWLQLSNLDTSYDYIKVYYSRATSDIDQNRYTTAYEILKKFPISAQTSYICITGNEEVQETTTAQLNVQYFFAKTFKTATQCSNRLFIGNVTTTEVDYEDLKDLSLRIQPSVVQNAAESFIGNLNAQYQDISTSQNKNEYYNPKNIYYRVGYWNEEFYRFGIVYILNDGSLSSVFNVAGGVIGTSVPNDAVLSTIEKDDKRTYLTIDEGTSLIHSTNLNAKGVCRISVQSIAPFEVLGIKFNIPNNVYEYLKEKVRGFFFVRQKRIPTKIAQMYLLAHDNYSGLPLLNTSANTTECSYEGFFAKGDKHILSHQYNLNLRKNATTGAVDSFAGICPESELNQKQFNEIFTGSQFYCKLSENNRTTQALSNDPYYVRHYTAIPDKVQTSNDISTIYCGNIPDSSPLIVFQDIRFRASAGEASTAYKFQYISAQNKDSDAENLVRGNYGPYVGVYGKRINFTYGQYLDIFAPGFDPNNIQPEFTTRYEDDSEYMAIGPRYQLDLVVSQNNQTDKFVEVTQYRGDCFICQFTHRLNRNFQDPSAPINDDIVEPNSWRDNYDIDDLEKTSKINRGDVNAVQLGSWVTVKVYASRNLSLRTTDLSYPTEQGMNGHPRGFYPYHSLSTAGTYKIPESGVLNDGFGSTLGERWNHTLPDVPYYKNIYQTRIYYSDIAVNDAYKNGYRIFRETNFRDYPIIYGGLMKMVTCKSSIIAIFEHGICLLPVNERTQTASSEGGAIFINTNNVLPENPSSIISDRYGTQWPESVVQTPSAVYGVDTVAKKIWRIGLADLQLTCISDSKVQHFLNENIQLGEFVTTPIIGVRNVKSHYNAFKYDVMFTFYNQTYDNEEKAWNLCFNEGTGKFTTFYSWIPSYSENIDNMYFSFNRETSKWFAKLAMSVTGNALARGITVEDPIIDPTSSVYTSALALTNIDYDSNSTLTFTLLPDKWENYKKFDIEDGELTTSSSNDLITNERPVIYLNIKCTISKEDEIIKVITSTIALTTKDRIAATYKTTDSDEDKVKKSKVTTFFWKHGQAGLQEIADVIKPTFWYGKQHPFEFEFVVNDQPSIHKIFTNLQIISNNAEPDSFHYEIVGDVYDFADEKKNMYYRQEATKCLYQNLGSDISYDHLYLSRANTAECEYLAPEWHKYKSVIFPLTYYRQDKIDEVEDSYIYYSWATYGRDFRHLTGSEITYDWVTGEYHIWTHNSAQNIRTVGRLRGNMQYKEDRFDIQIGSLIYAEKDEPSWSIPPISVIGPLPNDILTTNVTFDANDHYCEQLKDTEIADKYTNNDINTGGWGQRKETKLRDKSMRVRIRYKGDKLAIIASVITLYTQSYA